MPEIPSRFVAIAIGEYTKLPKLPQAVPGAHRLAGLLHESFQFDCVVLPDLERGPLLDAVEEHCAAGEASHGVLVVSWTGHAKVGVDDTLRLMGRSKTRDIEVATAGHLGEWAARTGFRQVLVLIDTCYSGQGLVDAVKVANAVNSGRAAPGSAWFGVVAASLADEPARAGVLARELQRLLTEGPRNHDFRWDKSRPYIRADDLVQALIDDWREPRHRPFPISFGKAWDFIHNPLYMAGIPDQPVEHLLLAARGSSGEESFFTGRERQLAEIVAWLGQRTPGLFVVTGPPGSGKSAVVGRIVSLSFRDERARLIEGGARVLPKLDPGESSVHAQLHARGVTVDTASAELARQLGVDVGVGALAVLSEARRRRKAGNPLVVAIDGLDEAHAFSGDLAVELVQPLAREALVLVSTRNVPSGETTLVAQLGPAARIVDLGQDVEGTRRDVHAYTLARLAGIDAAMNAEKVARALAQDAGEPSAAPFLLARLVTSQLQDRPVDTSSDGWQMALAATVESALERDLQGIVLEIAGQPHPAAAREMVRALALAYGAGFPADDVWPVVATAFSQSGTAYDRNHAYRVLETMGRHLIAGTEGDQPVYRIAHQRLIDYLATDPAGDSRVPTQESIKTLLSDALFELYDNLLESGLKPRSHPYLWRYAWLHLAEGGDSGIAHLRRLVERDSEAFLPDLARGLGLAGSIAWSEGEIDRALAMFKEEVSLRRGLSDLLRLALALSHLAVVCTNTGDEHGAEQAANEAVEIAMALGDQPEGLSVVSAALVTRGRTQAREGRLKEARVLANEVIEMLAPVEGGGDLQTWKQLAMAYELAGQIAVSMQDIEEAVRLCQRAIDLVDAHHEAEDVDILLASTLSTLASVQYYEALSSEPDETGTYRPSTSTAGERLLRERKSELGPVYDVAASRGLLFLVRTRKLDESRGIETKDAVSIPAIVDEVIRLVESHADLLADAATTLADALLIRAELRVLSDPAGATNDDARAEQCLRRFADQSMYVAVQLGLLLDIQNHRSLLAMVQGSEGEASTRIDRQKEAVALIRKGTSLLHRMALGEALGRFAVLLRAGGCVDLDAAAGAEAIDVWRSLLRVTPRVLPKLVASLVDQAARLCHDRTSEAIDLAREAVELVGNLPQTQFAALTGGAYLNLASAQLIFGVTKGNRELLENAIAKLEPSTPHLLFSNLLATAYLNLATIELDCDRFEEGLRLAEKAVKIYSTDSISQAVESNELLARLVLGRAQRACGQVDLGSVTLKRVIEDLRTSVVAGRTDLRLLAGALNTAAPEMWNSVLEELRDNDELVWRLALMRRRPRREKHLTVREVLDALTTAKQKWMRFVRESARAQRSFDSEAFDEAWLAAADEIPLWLTVDPSIEWNVIAWFNTPTWSLSRDYLRSHPALLAPITDVVLEEFRFDGDADEIVDLHLEVLASARDVGVDAAFAPMLSSMEANEWIQSDDPKAHLADHPQLVRPEILALLGRRGSEGSAVDAKFGAILELVQRNERDLAFKALDDPNAVAEYLPPAWRSADSRRLAALATILLNGDTVEVALKRTAAVALAIARVLQGDEQGLDQALAEALEGAATDERKHLATLVGDAVAHHPADASRLAHLVPLLSDAPPGSD